MLSVCMLKEQRSRMKLERVCCYLARPAASEQRFALTKDDRVRYELKSNGTTSPMTWARRLKRVFNIGITECEMAKSLPA